MAQLITQSMAVLVLSSDVVSIRGVAVIGQLFQFSEAMVPVLRQLQNHHWVVMGWQKTMTGLQLGDGI